jgi:hypothetical protein
MGGMRNGAKVAPDSLRHDPAMETVRKHRRRFGVTRWVNLSEIDGRTSTAKAARALIRALSVDLGDDLTAGEQQLVVRAAMLGAMVADQEARWIAGKEIDLQDYLTTVNTQRRVLQALGLQRRPKPVDTWADMVKTKPQEGLISQLGKFTNLLIGSLHRGTFRCAITATTGRLNAITCRSGGF